MRAVTPVVELIRAGSRDIAITRLSVHAVKDLPEQLAFTQQMVALQVLISIMSTNFVEVYHSYVYISYSVIVVGYR